MQTATQTLIQALKQTSTNYTKTQLQGEYVLLKPAAIPCMFIDGSNASIITAPSLCAQTIRTAQVSCKENVWSRKVQQFQSLARLTTEQTCIVENFGTNFQCGPFDVLANDLRQGLHAATPALIEGVVRRLAELNMAQQNMPLDGMLVLDGELSAQTYSEKEPLAKLHAIASERNTLLAGLSKTSTLVNAQGASFPSQLLSQGPKAAWLFVADTHQSFVEKRNATTGFVKLNAQSQHVFKLDVSTPEQLLPAANALASQANDAQLPGYPYGLIAADQIARITTSESNMYSQQVLASTEQELKTQIASVDAHCFF